MDSMWRAWHSMVIKCMCKWLKLDLYSSSGLETRLAFVHASLGTRSSKNQKGGSGNSAGVEVYTAAGMKAHF